MFKVEIVLDEEKILRGGKIDLDEMWLEIDNHYSQYGLPKVKKGVYTDAGRERDWSCFWQANLKLREYKLFRDNVVKWHWYNSDEAKIDAKYTGEDLISEYNRLDKKHKL